MWFRNIFRRPDNRQSAISNQQSLGNQPTLNFPPSAYRQLDRLLLRASRHLRGTGAGLRPSTRRRPAAEFLEHRQYVSGDDVRFVDWKASARSENVYLKQGEQPQETTVHIFIDTSSSMAWGNPPKSHAALSLAAAMGYLTLANEDRLQIIPLENQRSSVTVRVQNYKGKAQFPTLLNHLHTLPFDRGFSTAQGKPFYGKTDLTQPIRDFSRTHPRGGVVLIISDLLDVHNLTAALATLPRPTWEVTIFHLLHPHELTPRITGQFEIVDTETGRSTNYDITPQALDSYRKNLQTWRNAIELACIENKAFYALLPTDWSLEKEVIPHLRKLRVLEPV